MKLKNNHGFTLIEMLVVVGLITGGYALAILFGFNSKSLLRTEAKSLSQNIRYLHQLASTESRYYRLVFDLESGEYSFEVSDDPIFVRQQSTDDDEETPEDPSMPLIDEDADDEESEPVPSVFQGSEDELLEEHELDSSIKFYQIFIEHQADNKNLGKAYLNFFPNGQTEFAVIQFSDLDETQFMSLIVNPLTGGVEIRDEIVDYTEILSEIKSD